jgi:hypothetical protein
MHLGSLIPFAILLGLLSLFVLIFLYEWVYHFSERTATDVIPYLRAINLEEITSLFDSAAENRLRLDLPPREFKKSQWKRCHLALQYVGDLAHNAKVFQEWSKYERTRSRRTLDRETRRVSLDLTIVCAQCRICAVAVRLRIGLGLMKMAVLPFAAAPSFTSLPRMGSVEMVTFYRQIRTAAIILGQAYGENYQRNLAHVL